MHRFFILTVLIGLFFLSCKKEEDKTPVDPFPVLTPAPSNHTNFIFTGTMNVDKYDSNWVSITNYSINQVTSKLLGTKPDFQLSTTFDASNLKGQTPNNIPVNIPNNSFSAFSNGVGIFSIGVMNGYYSKDSLYYHVVYHDQNNDNNFYLDFSGKLTSSY